MSFKIGDMSKAVSILMGDYIVKRKTQVYEQGELVESFSETPIHCAVLPMTGRELRNLPEGEYDMEDKMILSDGSLDLALGDVIVAFGSEFEIRIKKDVSDLVNLKTYTAKKIPPSPL
ncbi:MAG TPA: hypothetical protein PK079_25070 [Leptospiraceae bacterium]|nr:hypothetical protein [Leptospiraceae bacterium]HMW08596.1 hypothetical protein [Leptospiraceae bacterium]HMZ66555.1 hypothetical protein [Leptospiraceae bacterium]HNA10225.1 hypothetical protein [Leptospiraceae bacterium]HNB98559.1 hypothetical protein [Leptospiraceae bacterium]